MAIGVQTRSQNTVSNASQTASGSLHAAPATEARRTAAGAKADAYQDRMVMLHAANKPAATPSGPTALVQPREHLFDHWEVRSPTEHEVSPERGQEIGKRAYPDNPRGAELVSKLHQGTIAAAEQGELVQLHQERRAGLGRLMYPDDARAQELYVKKHFGKLSKSEQVDLSDAEEARSRKMWGEPEPSGLAAAWGKAKSFLKKLLP